MKLLYLIRALGDCRLCGRFDDFRVRGVSSNSKAVARNFIFVAIKGARQDGRVFIREAIERGARAVVSLDIDDKGNDPKVTFINVSDDRLALARLADAFYGHPSRKVKVIGITGTNGKTTVAYLLEALLKGSGFTTGVIGTISYRFKDEVIESKNTTPGPLELQAMLVRMSKAGVDFAVMEVSSHALDQQRVGGIDFTGAIFTNLTQDHLDYHVDLENYFCAKSKLFNGLKASAQAVINNDDPYAARLKELTHAEVITYAIDNAADVTARDINLSLGRSDFILKTPSGDLRISTPLIGRHNVYNILAAVSWGIRAGLNLTVMQKVLEKFELVPGRLEKIKNNRGLDIFIDYAHTEDALKNVISALRQVTFGRIIVVFGCGGERDKDKRPKMGRVVTELADYAIITSDNPRSEDPRVIAEDIKRGIAKGNYEIIIERRQAIVKSLSLACPGDVVLIAGKGHENCQIFKNTIVHFDDRQITRECLS